MAFWTNTLAIDEFFAASALGRSGRAHIAVINHACGAAGVLLLVRRRLHLMSGRTANEGRGIGTCIEPLTLDAARRIFAISSSHYHCRGTDLLLVAELVSVLFDIVNSLNDQRWETSRELGLNLD